ncbi:hypothetical protein N0824_00491 [Microcystis sp. 0824]|uniref:hypothetical protein n=1 Tax=Microcystis sp. 0824 TaxID=1502726 RepID=UPI000D0C53A6|nr:hypothetical protein [Microcystis sp. 0824]GBF52642.1 hypothetical protein N0824_00491 [Microcystis sp. 0824]
MNAAPLNSHNKLLVITSLTGTDEKIVLEQTEKLQPPVPSQGDPEYQTFLKNFLNSPANVMSTIADFLRIKAKWKINSIENYQDYLNLFENVPFGSISAGSDLHYKTRHNSVSSLVSETCTIAYVPQSKQKYIYDLKAFLGDVSEGNPKTLTIITQNLQATDGRLMLLFNKSNFIVSSFRPQTYNLSAESAIATLTIIGPSYFQQNGAQFLRLGFTNVTDWINKTSTPTPS